jgi:hypothetical protein
MNRPSESRECERTVIFKRDLEYCTVSVSPSTLAAVDIQRSCSLLFQWPMMAHHQAEPTPSSHLCTQQESMIVARCSHAHHDIQSYWTNDAFKSKSSGLRPQGR